MFKMLSLDGGGSWAILQLLTLKEKYGNQTGHEILREFDLVIANSGGSIVLAALAENWSIDKALDLFKTEANRKLIFNSNSFSDRFFPFDFIKNTDLNTVPQKRDKHLKRFSGKSTNTSSTSCQTT